MDIYIYIYFYIIHIIHITIRSDPPFGCVYMHRLHGSVFGVSRKPGEDSAKHHIRWTTRTVSLTPKTAEGTMVARGTRRRRTRNPRNPESPWGRQLMYRVRRPIDVRVQVHRIGQALIYGTKLTLMFYKWRLQHPGAGNPQLTITRHSMYAIYYANMV